MVDRRPILSAPAVEKPTSNGSGPPTLAQVEAEIEAALAAGKMSLQDKFGWFEKKLRAALSDSSASASELAKLLTETDNAVIAAQQQATVAREAAYDPSTDLSQARNAMEDAQFFVGRLQTQRPRLEALLHARLLQESTQAYVAKLNELAPQRDALAQELHDTYEATTSKLLDVFARVKSFEQRARSALGSPPPNVDVLERIDMRVLDKTVLPSWQNPEMNIWPPLNSFAAGFASTMVVQQGPGAAWSSDFYQERRRAEIAAEQQRMALHAEAQAKQQLDRENKELREQFQQRQQNGRI